ncbi:DEAD/DEAH box helicase [Micromonospora yangpuensis]|uniref:Non-specific serine/threonine protein kinase n=1 Tax=Micromonospora yangpuensis TaxID=683228 RepID=A0A1C6V1T8_9ACTN|nr:DEAD/DEAH box helicase [Micromonospora yangpuensis]GGL98055.1 helicase HelZ [Micromonospora yangpuensis]SCL60278.1 non-specific serine/threonine protein kinase [Micromonospora yangpuensis]
MLVVHGVWLPGSGLAVWAEDSNRPARAPRRPGRPPRERPHPFAADHATLAGVLGAAAADQGSPGAAAEPGSSTDQGSSGAATESVGPPGTVEATTVLCALPTRAGSPLESPELVRADAGDPARGPVTLAAWRAPALRYAPDAAHHLLLTVLAEPVVGQRPWVAGAGLRWLVSAARFAEELVGRGRVLPGVAGTPADAVGPAAVGPAAGGSAVGGSAAVGPTVAGPGAAGRAGRTGARGRKTAGRAVWRPLLTGADAAWARSLALALPPVVRSAQPAGSRPDRRPTVPAEPTVPPGTTVPARTTVPVGADEGSVLVAEVLDELTDAATRAALHRAGLQRAGLASGGPRGGAAPAWLAALTGPDGGFTADPAALDTLRTELDAWQRDAAGGAVRASFRLVEPAPEVPLELLAGALSDLTEQDGQTTALAGAAEQDGQSERDGQVGQAAMLVADGTWRVEFGLQSADRPGLHVGAGQIWAAGSEAAGELGIRPDQQVEELLLAELGRASRLWPELDGALRTAAPQGLDLDTEGAHRFLREGAPVLHAAGFGVLLPGWWRRPSARLGARLRAGGRTAPGTVAGAGGGVGLDALVDYRWEVALGDELLSADELAALAELKTPLVRLRGQWVELDQKRLATGLRLLRSRGELTVADLLRLGLADADETDALPVLEITADGALGDLLTGRAEQRLTPLDAPPGFVGTLRPYQRRGLAWLAFLQSLGLGGILADDMGLGKTVQLLALLAHDPPGTGPTLLVCPMSLVGNWQREAATFTPKLRVHVHHGAERARGAAFAEAVQGADLVLTTYSVAARDAVELAGTDWHRVVVDEAQAIKNAATRQAEAVRTLPARHRVAVTGTPVENRLADLWSIMQFANPGLLGPAASFRQSYAVPIERHGDTETAARLRRMTGPFVLRRLKTDSSIISDLPEKLEMEVVCNLTAEQASLYRVVVDEMLAKIETSDGMERRGLVLATMTRLKQICNHPAQLLRDGSALPGRSGKLARLEEILDEVLAAGEKALLFTQYAEFGGMLRAHLSARFGREVLFLHGGVGKADRDSMVTRFQSADGPALFVLSLKAGGTGLTLTAANHVVHVDRWWNPAVEDQATDRAFRIGQRRRVQVRKFVCAGTVEEKVAEMIRQKRDLAAQVVGSGEQWVTELSTGQLRELFTLGDQAVVE